MAYLGNGAAKRLNLHYAIYALAAGLGGVFFSAVLLRAGVTPLGVLLTLASIFALRFCLRPLVLPLAKRFGLKPLVIAGALAMGGFYPLLAQVRGLDVFLALACLVSAAADALYWTCYHAYFSNVGDAAWRGRQTGARDAIAGLIGIGAPIAGGFALHSYGPIGVFWIVAFVQVAAVTPLLYAPNVEIKAHAPAAFRAALGGVAMYGANGWIGAGNFHIWNLLLFVSLERSFTAYGGAVALAALVGAITGIFLGRHIDSGGGARAANLAMGAIAFTIALRALSAAWPHLALVANAAGALSGALYGPAFMTAIYNQSKPSPCALRFHIATEGMFDVAVVIALLLAAAALSLGATLGFGVASALAGVALLQILLQRYYRATVQA